MCREWDVSIRRACGVLEFDTSTYHYKARRRDQAGIEARIKDICETRVRYGYRRVHVLLRREGHDINEKRTRRIYSELGMQLRNKTPKRRVKAKLREDRQEAIGPNDVWAMDFVHDQLATGTKLRILTVVDTFSRYVPVLDPRFNYRAENVVSALDKACSRIGYPSHHDPGELVDREPGVGLGIVVAALEDVAEGLALPPRHQLDCDPVGRARRVLDTDHQLRSRGVDGLAERGVVRPCSHRSPRPPRWCCKAQRATT